MKRVRRYFFALLTLLIGARLEAETIVITDIDDHTGQIKPAILSAARDLVEQAYRSTGKYQILSVEQARRFITTLKERKCTTTECQIALGKAVKADIVVVSSIDFFAGIYTITFSLIQVKAKQKVEGGAADFNGTAVGMKSAIEQIAARLTGTKPSPSASVSSSTPAPASAPLPPTPSPPTSLEQKYQKANFQALPKEAYAIPTLPKETAPQKIEKGGVSFTSSQQGITATFAKGRKEEKVCTLPCTITDIDPGDYVVRFEKEGFVSREEVVRIEGGKTVNRTVQLSVEIADKVRLSEELIEASKNGDIKEMRRLFVLGADVNYHNAAGYSALLVAALAGQFDAAEVLVVRGARFTDVEIGTLLLMIVETNNLSLLRLLTRQKADLNFRYEQGRTILWHAVEKQRWSIFDQLVKAGVDTSIKDNSGQTILMWTIENGMEKVAQMLKNYGLKLDPVTASKMLRETVAKENIIKLRGLLPFVADVNPVYEDGFTPLWYAAIKGRTDIAEMLLAAGADPNVKDKNKKSLLTYCLETRKFDLASRLIEHKASLSVQEANYLLQKGVALGDADLVRVVLKSGANVNQKFDDGMSPIWVAAFNNNREMVQLLAAAGANINSKDNDGRTILMWAIENNRKELAQVILASGANVNLLDNKKRTALSIAIEKNNLALVDLLLRYKAQVNIKDENGNAPLTIATATGNFPMVQILVAGGATVNTEDKMGNTPLVIAIYKNYNDIARFLIEHGADVNKANRDKRTPVHIAVMRGARDLLDLLLEKGAEIDKPDVTGATPLIYAKRDNRFDLVSLLLQRGAKISSREEMEELFTYACQNGYDVIVEELIKRRVDINRRFADGSTPIWLAVMNGNSKVIKMLVQAGADIEARDKEGMTPLVYAAAKKEEHVVITLINLGAEINAKDKGLNTPLHYCASRGFAQAVAHLIRKGANLTDKDDKGRTPMVRAQFTGNYDIVDMLKRAGAYE